MTRRATFHAARDTTVSGKLDDPDEDWTRAELPELPCRRCGKHPIQWPHSICAQCIETRRKVQ